LSANGHDGAAAKRGDPVTPWARRVVAGKVIAGPGVRAACQRHLDDLTRAAALGIVWKPAHARWAITFFSNLKHTRGEWAGRPLTLEPWQAFIVGSLWGWRMRDDGTRRFREAYIEVPRKNGKSTLASGIGLLLAFFDEEAGARVYAAATKKDQAKIVWEQAKEITQHTPALARRITPGAHALTIASTGQKFEPLGADTDVLDGLDVSGAIVDELHAHKTSAMVDVLRTATVSRRQSLIFYITTAAKERTGICGIQHDYAEAVLAGRVEGVDWFAFIASADPGDDWRAESTWRKANPNFGVSVRPDRLKRDAARAAEMPALQSAFRRLHLNEWLQQDNRAVDEAVWRRCGQDYGIEALRGRVGVIGLDLAARIDVTAATFVALDEDDGITVWPLLFIPEDNIEKRVKRDRGAPFDVWVANGHVIATPGNLIDAAVVRRELVAFADVVHAPTLAMDPWQAATLGTDLRGDGFEVVEVPQRMPYLAEPTKHFLALLETGKLRHPNNPCLDWMAGNLALVIDAQGNMMPNKGRAAGRIDGISALITALSRLMVKPEGEESAYADHGLVVL
jgi:phage terminase large subunit-like protein